MSRANDHALLASRQHDVCPAHVLQEPYPLGTNQRDNDMIFFVSCANVRQFSSVSTMHLLALEGVYIEAPIFPR